MFELSVAAKYLTPRWRQLSVSIISLISILVIALVVWLIVVFFSVTYGLEKSWIEKLIALTAPVRITPTERYYQSYYFQIDSLSGASEYSYKSLHEKMLASATDPYNPTLDSELPENFPKPDVDDEGNVKDLVKIVYQAIDTIPDIHARDYEMTASNIHLRLIRSLPGIAISSSMGQYTQSSIGQATYLGSFDSDNPSLSKAIQKITMEDIANILALSGISSDNITEDEPAAVLPANKDLIQSRLKRFFSVADIHTLQTQEPSWIIPKNLFPNEGSLAAHAYYRDGQLVRMEIDPGSKSSSAKVPEGYVVTPVVLFFEKGKPFLIQKNGERQELPPGSLLSIPGGIDISAKLDRESLSKVVRPEQIIFDMEFTLQGVKLAGKAPMRNLAIKYAEFTQKFENQPEMPPLWMHQIGSKFILPSDPILGDGIILPRGFRDSGVRIGDRGFLTYHTPTASSIQEQRMPIFVAGFYDPGIIPIGGKYALASPEITGQIRAAHNQEDTVLSNGINVRFHDLQRADQIKTQLRQALKEAGIAPYWKIETYREFDFTRDIIQQLRSEKNLFTLLATIIIIVACSNIISMLIILVNDKKIEIGIMRAMGASSRSIAAIFGICGMVMGFVGSVVGIIAAVITLHNLQAIVNFIGRVQGYDMFNPVFYGETLPAEINIHTLGFVIIATAIISLLAGLVPAIKASMMRPSVILRAE